MLGHGMPGYPGSFGDGAVIRLVGAKLHVLPDLPLLFGKFFRRYNAPHPVLDGFPLGVQLLDEHFQFLLTLFTGMGVDALGSKMPGVRFSPLEPTLSEKRLKWRFSAFIA